MDKNPSAAPWGRCAPLGARAAVAGCLVLLSGGLLVSGCTATYHMGDPLAANPKARSERLSAPEAASAGAEHKADQWERRWREIQGSSDNVSWSDHFQVCGLKYRFRNYDQLFRCLDLLDAKIAAGGKRVPKADVVRADAPVMTGWLRATAYAELGEPEIALKWALTAWAALPEAYRRADSRIAKDYMFGRPPDLSGLESVAWTLGSGGLGDAPTKMEEEFYHEGRNNPAALDLRPTMIAMSLAVQRSLLYERLGNEAQARAALADLKLWEGVRRGGSVADVIGFDFHHTIPLKGQAQLMSIGPEFAFGNYPRVIKIYEVLARKVGSKRKLESAEHTANWTLFLPITLVNKILSAPGDLFQKVINPSDARLFALAVEDVSNALIYAQSLERTGRMDDAAAMLDTLLALPEIRAMGNLYWVTLYERARIALGSHQQAEGIGLLKQSVDAIESVRSTISFEAAKIGFAGDKQTVYAALITALAQDGDWRGAFEYAERAKARALVDLLAQRHDLGPPPAADARVRALFAHAATTDSSVGVATDAQTVRGIEIVADARSSLAAVAPEAASLVSVQRVDTAAIAARIGAEETLVDYYFQGDGLYAFVVTGARIRGFRLPADGVDEDVRAFREDIERRAPQAREVGHRLYDRLIRPLLPAIAGPKLTIAPHGVLHYLPFAALWDGERYLLDRFSVRLEPSASTLIYLRTDRPSRPGVLLAFGNPDLGDRRYDLPNAQVEATSVAAMFPQSRALVRAEASKTAVRDLGSGFSMLHFATHGHFDADEPLKSGLYLARGSDPDGVLTVSDLYSLRLDADLVTLSACETGLGKVANGDDVIGLTRGFLYAGVRSIVASLWEVDDAATAHLMESFYRDLARHDKREALRVAQIETRSQYPDPWFWAAFNIVGRAD